MYKRKMFQAPLFWSDRDDKRRVAWHELFYDLFFVSIFFQLGHSIVYIESIREIFSFLVTFVAIWWVWSSLTHYYKKFETYGLEKRIGTFILIIPTAGLAVFAPNMLDNNYVPFVVSYIIAQICLLILWSLSGKFNPSFKRVAHTLTNGFLIAIILMIISLYVPNIFWRNTLFLLALIIEVLTPVLTFRSQKKVPTSHENSKLPERYGLFTLIVVGETIASSVSIAQSDRYNGYLLIVALLGIAIGFCLWWIYHDFVARRIPHQKPLYSFLWGYLHLPIMIFLSFMGVGIARLSLITSDTIQSISLTHFFMVLAVSGFLITAGFLETFLDTGPYEPSHKVISPLMKILSGVVVFWLGIFMISSLYSTVAIFLMLIVFLILQLIYSAYTWFNTPIENENDFMGQVVEISGR